METTVETPNEILTVFQESGLEKSTELSLKEAFIPFYDQAKEWAEKAKALVVTSADQKEEMKQAREARLALKNIRVQADKTRKALKEDSIKYGKAVQGVYNVLDFMITPTERHLKEQEDFIEIQDKKRKEQLKEDREKALEPYDVGTQFMSLGEMPDEVWNNYFSGVKSAHATKIEAEQKAEQERLEKIRLDKVEQERRIEIAPYLQFIPGNNPSPNLREMTDEAFECVMIELREARAKYEKDQEKLRKENEALKAAQEKERKRQEKIEAERKSKEEKERQEREAQAKKEREAHEAALKKEREERARIEAEIKAKEEATRIAEQEILKAQRKAQLAPDKDKLLALADQFENIQKPSISHPEATQALVKIGELQAKMVTYIREQANKL